MVSVPQSLLVDSNRLADSGLVEDRLTIEIEKAAAETAVSDK